MHRRAVYADVQQTGIRRRISQHEHATTKHMTGAVLKHLYHARGSDGADYEVHVYAEPAHKENAWIERITKVCLADGGELRVLSRRHYEVLASGVTLETSDPDAI